MAGRLVERDPSLWLSRSWTTRARRRGEAPDAYTFVDRKTFEEHRAAGGFLESAEFLGHLYGTPIPDPPASKDVLLEIDLQGAQQVKALHPDALVVLLLPPRSRNRPSVCVTGVMTLEQLRGASPRQPRRRGSAGP